MYEQVDKQYMSKTTNNMKPINWVVCKEQQVIFQIAIWLVNKSNRTSSEMSYYFCILNFQP